MELKKDRITGKIQQGDLKVTFVGENHYFTFVREDDNPISGINDTLKAKGGFIEGRTSDDKSILIYTKDDIKVKKTKEVYTWLYIVAKNVDKKISDCDGIQFSDGTLRSLFYRNSLEMKNSVIDKIDVRDDSIEIDIKSDLIDKIVVKSVVSESSSIREGKIIDNSQVELELSFSKKTSVCESFQEEYNTICELCRFLTFRSYVTFEKVSIFEYGDNDLMHEIGICYVRRDNEYVISRDPIRCITFNELNSRLKELYLYIRGRDEKKSKYCIDFIPETPKDINRITPEIIRKVCTSAEFEAKMCKIPVAKNDSFIELKKKIKEVINQSKESDNPLTKKEYDYIIGSLKFLDGPLEERMKNLYERFECCVERIMSFYDVQHVTEEDIHNMIKVRNGVSHGSAIASIEVEAYTAKVFMGIIYASVLYRCNCSKEEIKKWIDDGLMTLNDA